MAEARGREVPDQAPGSGLARASGEALAELSDRIKGWRGSLFPGSGRRAKAH